MGFGAEPHLEKQFMAVDNIKVIKCFIYGLVFGFSSPIPGVSAGSLAVILNVYETFFSSINVAYLKKNLLPTITFLLGWGLGLYGVSSVILFLFENHAQIISFGFKGLILGCVPIIYKKATTEKVQYQNVVLFLVAVAFMFFLSFTGSEPNTNNTIEQMGVLTPAFLAWLFLASFISSIAILIPGVGGSLMMLAFGIYTIYIETISTLNPILLIIFVVSMILGVLAGIIITKKMLVLYSQTLYFSILGFIIGSLVIIYPGFSMDIIGVLSIITAIICAVFAYWLSKKG